MSVYRRPSPEQAEVAKSILGEGPTEVVVSGPYGSGKTGWVVPVWLTWLCGTHEGREGVLAARSIDSFRATVMGEVEPWARHHGIATRREGDGVWVGRNYLWRVIGSNVRSHERLKGRNIVGGVVDEAVDLPQSLIEQVAARCRVEPMRLVYATNPDGPAHPFRTEVIDPIIAGRRQGRYHELPLWANPGLPLSYVTDQSRRLVGMMRDRYLLGRWVAATGAVYPFVGDAVARPPKDGPWRSAVAVDVGVSVPTHALLMEHHKAGKVWAAAEWRHDPMNSSSGPMPLTQQAREIVRWVLRTSRSDQFGVSVVDNAEPAFCEVLDREFRNRGHRVIWAEYGKGTIASGVRAVERRMVDKLLHISPACEFLLQEMAGLTWDQSPFGRGLERPDPEKPDHGADALRYYVVGVLENYEPQK